MMIVLRAFDRLPPKKRAALFFCLLCISFLVCCPSLGFADFEKGRKAAQQGRFAEAIKNWEPLAKAGDARSQHNMGRMYANGDGVPQDFSKAFKWFLLAADQGYSPSYLALGKMYSRGDGVEVNLEEAETWSRRALREGEAAAAQLIHEIEKLKGAAPQVPTPEVSFPNSSAAQPLNSSVAEPINNQVAEEADPWLGLVILALGVVIIALVIRNVLVRLGRLKRAIQEQLRQQIKHIETKTEDLAKKSRFGPTPKTAPEKTTNAQSGFNPHAILSVPVGVTQHELLKVYREKMHKNQPDKNAAAANPQLQRLADERAVLIHRAYDALKMGGIRRADRN